ncbi:MAG: hypothetical protein J6P02_03865 [Lachnospiraceae bacterium]|nr:hypothetical protein [Lachnospiraceae bacterium]
MKKSEWKNIIGKKRIYNHNIDNKDAIWEEVLKIEDEQEILLRFISKNSANRQGVFIGFTGCEGTIDIENVENKNYYRSADFWEDLFPQEVKILCKSKEGLLCIYHIYERNNEKPKINGIKTRYSAMPFQAMLLEKKDNIYRYYCNHATKDSPFDALVFEIELL